MSFFFKLLLNSGIICAYLNVDGFLLPILLVVQCMSCFGFDFVVVVGFWVHDFQLESITEIPIKLRPYFDGLGSFGKENTFLWKDRNSESLVGLLFFCIVLKNIYLRLTEVDMESKGFLGMWVVDAELALQRNAGKENIFRFNGQFRHLKVKN